MLGDDIPRLLVQATKDTRHPGHVCGTVDETVPVGFIPRLYLAVPKSHAEDARCLVMEMGLLDRTIKLKVKSGKIMIPLRNRPDSIQLEGFSNFNAELVEDRDPSPQNTAPRPLERVASSLDIPGDIKVLLPRKWEMLGDVLVLKMDAALDDWREQVAEAYAKELGAKSVLRDTRGISGELRRPDLELLWGTDTKTVHRENGVRFHLDVSRLMFSSGNIDERIRMATLPGRGETVVDLFAGIGYFTIPMAVHSRARRIISVEKNPEAFAFLKRNMEENRVDGKVKALQGDCRDMAPRNLADRVVMGYMQNTEEFLKLAVDVLGPEGGTVHYHDTVSVGNYPGLMEQRMENAASFRGYVPIRTVIRKIKSYAPSVVHGVMDAELVKNA